MRPLHATSLASLVASDPIVAQVAEPVPGEADLDGDCARCREDARTTVDETVLGAGYRLGLTRDP